MGNKVLSKSFIWMFIGLMVTFITGYAVATNETMLVNIYSNSIYLVLCIVELVLVVFLSAKVRTMGKNTARICFLLYSFMTGLTLSSIFVVYKLTSILFIFLIAAIVFLIFGLIGYFTNIDLSKFRVYLLMALIAIILCILINFFINNHTFDLTITIISILVFLGFTAYDVQKIKRISDEDYIPEENLSIICALDLYLDYINIFLDLLRLFGNSKD